VLLKARLLPCTFAIVFCSFPIFTAIVSARLEPWYYSRRRLEPTPYGRLYGFMGQPLCCLCYHFHAKYSTPSAPHSQLSTMQMRKGTNKIIKYFHLSAPNSRLTHHVKMTYFFKFILFILCQNVIVLISAHHLLRG